MGFLADSDSMHASPHEVARPFGRDLALQGVSLCPEIALWLLGETVDLEAECRELCEDEPARYRLR